MTAKKTEFIVTDLISKIFQRKTIMDKLPSQRELAEIYHVSRFTIQKVLGRLQSIGLIYMTQGDGTYINKKALGHPMVYNSLTEVPYEELRSRTLYLKQVEPTAELRRVFNLEAGETLWEFRRIRIVRYEISQVETGWMPCAEPGGAGGFYSELCLAAEVPHCLLYYQLPCSSTGCRARRTFALQKGAAGHGYHFPWCTAGWKDLCLQPHQGGAV